MQHTFEEKEGIMKRGWWLLAGISGLVTFLAYFVFGVLLHVYFPEGIFSF